MHFCTCVRCFINEALHTGRFGQHTDTVTENRFGIFLSKNNIPSDTQRVRMYPCSPCSYPQGTGTPHTGTAVNEQSWSSADRSTISYARASATCEKYPGRSQLCLGQPVPCPLRSDWNSSQPVQISAHRIAAAWIIFSSNNFLVSH